MDLIFSAPTQVTDQLPIIFVKETIPSRKQNDPAPPLPAGRLEVRSARWALGQEPRKEPTNPGGGVIRHYRSPAPLA